VDAKEKTNQNQIVDLLIKRDMDNKICPLKMLNTCGAACIRECCAWWNDDFGECAILALATTQTRPVVIREMRADRDLQAEASRSS